MYPGFPGGHAYGQQFPVPVKRRRTGVVVIAVVAALVVIGGVIASVLVLGGNSSNDDAKGSPTPSSAAPHGFGQAPGPGQTPNDPGGPSIPGDPGDPGAPAPTGPPVDSYDGIKLPVPSGWQGAPGEQGIGASVTTGQYPCPGDATQDCVRGGVFSQPAGLLKLTSTTAEAAAKEDIAPNATDSYGTAIYGKTTSHQEIASKSVTVAGQKGYLVRWKVVTASGTDGYVESLAFPSPADSGKLVVVRFGFDVGGKAPGLDLMDQITQGITADSSGGATGGAGTGV
ncbi:hypothetical protein [Streptomyces sp. SID4948]|uniref:hypothetical protein n=1 Tax=Streptomyces sp. SID4948 TaxID=2690287 RepID=UPI0031FCDA3A